MCCMNDHHQRPPEERIYALENQQIAVSDFESAGFILDIGGGGEGIIGELKGDKVIAIDLRKEELEEAPQGPLKIIMDAAALKFMESTFNTATAFFALMFIKPIKHREVFDEVFRVLKSGGRFLIWDIALPTCPDKNKDLVAFRIMVKLPQKEIKTGYGAPCPPKPQDISYYIDLAEKSGFKVVSQNQSGRLFSLFLGKP